MLGTCLHYVKDQFNKFMDMFSLLKGCLLMISNFLVCLWDYLAIDLQIKNSPNILPEYLIDLLDGSLIESFFLMLILYSRKLSQSDVGRHPWNCLLSLSIFLPQSVS